MARCAHNHLDGPTAVRFLLSCVRQRVLAPRLLAKLVARFRTVALKKRVVNKLVGGVLTFGASPPTVELYSGPTAREKLTSPAAQDAAGPGLLPSPAVPTQLGPGQEGESFGDVSRGDRRQPFPNDCGGQQLLWLALSQSLEFQADNFVELGGA
jgi:hypothetical protein